LCRGALRPSETSSCIAILKPSNILVTADGPCPKLLDFGIAKLLERPAKRGATRSLSPRPTLRIMTPDHASPEQVRGTRDHDLERCLRPRPYCFINCWPAAGPFRHPTLDGGSPISNAPSAKRIPPVSQPTTNHRQFGHAETSREAAQYDSQSITGGPLRGDLDQYRADGRCVRNPSAATALFATDGRAIFSAYLWRASPVIARRDTLSLSERQVS